MALIKSKISGTAIAAILEEMEPILERHPRSHILIAGLTLAVLAQSEDISTEELQAIVLGASQYICSALDLTHSLGSTDELPKNMVN
jgi:hypothetical protein